MDNTVFPGTTEQGAALIRRSRSQADEPTGISDGFRLVTLWSQSIQRADLFHFFATTVTLGDVWKVIEATLEPQPRLERRLPVLWITAAQLIEESSTPCLLGTPTSVEWGQGATTWKWEPFPPIIWRRPNYIIPPPEEVRKRTAPECRDAFLRLTVPYSMR